MNLSLELKTHFGFEAFLEGQEAAVQACLDGRDAVVVMPTGSGKSLCYQLAALLLPGATLVVSPLIALMKDQVDGLEARGLPATFINSSLSAEAMRERLRGMDTGAFKLVYVAPERFRAPSFMQALRRMEVSLLAIDEAHCISQWGHDFRPDYCRLREVVEQLPRTRIMALTATATPEVREDIIAQTGLGQAPRAAPDVLVHGFSRPNLFLEVRQTASHQQKFAAIENTLRTHSTGIVYCATRKQTEKVHAELKARSVVCGCYHAGLRDAERQRVQNQFMGGELPVVVATNAFGMGVDRSDLRAVIHWDIPGSIEAYYQEVGRAGRDGKPSRCLLLFNYADVRTQEFFMEGSNPRPADIETCWRRIRTVCAGGPVARSMEEWVRREALPLSPMGLRTALGIVERAGLLRCQSAPGDEGTTIELVEGADEAALRALFPHLEAKRRAAEQKLKAMIRYASAPRCRHGVILDYFGDRDARAVCRSCDQCGGGDASRTLREPTEEEWVVVQKVLSCAARMRGRFGRARLVQVLRGSQDADLIQKGLAELPTYGLLRDCGEAYVRQIVDELIRDGSLALDSGEYPVVHLTERGEQVVRRRETPRVDWPSARAPAAAKARTKRGKAPAEDEGAFDLALFAVLKEWRRERAQASGVPAFVVMHDSALKGIAARRPDSIGALEAVKGMGPVRAERYGEELLAVVAGVSRR